MNLTAEFKDVTKVYGGRENGTYALRGASFGIAAGEFVVMLGPSGAGKSTILNLLGGLDRLSGGAILVDGEDLGRFTEKRLTEYRAEKAGFVFQFYNLIPTLTVYENVALIKEVSKNYGSAADAIEAVGLSPHKNKFPSQLSGGEQQRVSIARALVKNPPLLLCDEPTGALDSGTGAEILTLLKRQARAGRTVVVVTHNAALAAAADRVIRVRNGQVEGVEQNERPLEIGEVGL
ncbi:MAG: ABC transporter ATP-binding protein [Clostridiales bacterium]|nr:ABC transporter ATP-binding protein [Clostridiales bacterium]